MFKREKTATIYLLPSFLAIFYLCIGAYIAHPYMHHPEEHDTVRLVSLISDTSLTTDKSLEAPSTPSHHCLICSFLKANNSALVYTESLVPGLQITQYSPYSYQLRLYNKSRTTPYARGPPAV